MLPTTNKLTESEEKAIVEALEEKRYYNGHNVFHHYPEFYYDCPDAYRCKIHIVKWNTRSTRVTILYARYDEKKSKWILKTEAGVKRMGHGEKMNYNYK